MSENLFEKKITIKEASEILGVSHDQITEYAKKLFPEIVKNGKKTFLTEFQITEIKKLIRPTGKSVANVTDLEMLEKGREFLIWQQEKINSLKKENENQKLLIEEQKPKVEFCNLLTESKQAYSIGNAVRLLKLSIGRNKFFEQMRKDKILMSDNLPYQDKIEAGYFRVILEEKGNHFYKITLVTGKGLEYLRFKYSDYIEKGEIECRN